MCKVLNTGPLNIGSVLAINIMIITDPAGCHILQARAWRQVCRWTQVHMWTHPCVCMCTHAHAQLTASCTGGAHARVHAHSETHTGGGCRRWNLSHRDQSCGWCFCPDFRGSMLHFEQGNVWGMGPSLQVKGQWSGPCSYISLLPRPAATLVLTQDCLIWASSPDLALSSTESAKVGRASPLGL